MSAERLPGSVPEPEEDEWKLTYEHVPPHPMCCDRCKAVREAAEAFLDSTYQFNPERYRHEKRRLEIALGREPVTEELVMP